MPVEQASLTSDFLVKHLQADSQRLVCLSNPDMPSSRFDSINSNYCFDRRWNCWCGFQVSSEPISVRQRGYRDHHDEPHCIVCGKCLYSCLSKDIMQVQTQRFVLVPMLHTRHHGYQRVDWKFSYEYRSLLCHYCCWRDLVLAKENDSRF